MKEHLIKRIRKDEYPVTDQYTYLNHAAVAPINRRSEKYLNIYLENMMLQGNTKTEEVFSHVDQAKRDMAHIIEAGEKELAFVKNTTAGLNLVANGIHWEKDDEIILPEKEFPANVYPWLRLKEKGVVIKRIIDDFSSNRINLIKKSISSKTKLIAISFVQYFNGYREDLEKISSLCADNNVMLCVDAIQGMGALPLSVKKIPIDFMTWSCHKWMLGPEGVGFLYINKKRLETLKVKNAGWLRRIDFMDFSNTNQALVPEAAKFEEGTLNVAGIMTLKGSLDIINEIGMEDIKKKIFALNRHLMKILKEKNYKITSFQETAHESGILTFYHPDKPSEKLHGHLMNNKIICSLRNGKIRVAPHFYNTLEEMEKTGRLL